MIRPRGRQDSLVRAQSHVNQAALVRRDLELLALTTKGKIV
jgi:hypothetical protein